jgi:uncharacterized membrane protein
MKESTKINWLKKFKSWPLWAAIASFVALIVQQFWGFDIGDQLNDILTSLFGILILLGIVNNPNSRGTI